MLFPLLILALGSIFSGYLLKEIFIGTSSPSDFWTNSIMFLEPLEEPAINVLRE